MALRWVFAGLALVAAPVCAEAPPKPIDQIATDLANGECFRFLTEEVDLANDATLKALGFGPEITRRADDTFGELQLVSANLPDGQLAFGGTPRRACRVAVIGPNRDIARQSIKAAMGRGGLVFTPQANQRAGNESFQAPAGDQIVLFQLIDASSVNALLVQIFVINKTEG